jgi:S-adenosylmethionine hydrolase
MARPIITLLTDFGVTDTYVAQVKGAILRISPEAILVDLTHDVCPQDIATGALLLKFASPSFPDGTIHLAVVDPGVGTDRHPLLLVTPTAFFVGPDNGIFSHILTSDATNSTFSNTENPPIPPAIRGYQLTNPAYWRHPVSPTFHARDVFGPVAAHISLGVTPDKLGRRIGRARLLNLPSFVRGEQFVQGYVIHADRFGNLVTNIPGLEIQSRSSVVHIGRTSIYGLSNNYDEGDGLLALVGSVGMLEIAVKNGNAEAFLGISLGAPVLVEFPSI